MRYGPHLRQTAWNCGRRALRSESGKRHNRVATSVATSTKNAACTPMPHGHQTVPNLIPRVNSLLTMAKGRLAEHFREDRLGLLRQCGFKSTTRGGTVFTLFWCCFGASCRFDCLLRNAEVFAQVSSAESNNRVAWHMCHTPSLLLSDRRRMENRTAPAFARPYVISGFSYRSLTWFSLPQLREWLPPVRRNPAERRAPC